MHHYWGMGGSVINFARQNRIPAVRLRFNWGNLSYQRRFYSNIYNIRLKLTALVKTKYFCEIKSVTPELLQKRAVIDVMFHPVLNSNRNLTNYVIGLDPIKPMKKHLIVNQFNNF